MKRSRLLLAALAWPGVATAEAPFAPLPDVPDYVATYVVKRGFGSTRRDSRVVSHHGGWVRVDSAVDGQPRSPAYHGPGPLSFTTWDEPSGSDATLSIMRGPESHRSVGWSEDAVRTGDRAALLGESCEVWTVARSSIGGYGISTQPLERLSCITSDGIELWSRLVSGGTEGESSEATAIGRQPVGPGEVRPPVDRMALGWWLALSPGDAPGADAPGDVTVVMRSEQTLPGGRQIESRTVRRHHPWTSEESLYGDGRRKLAFTHASAGVTIVFEADAAKQPVRLTMTRHVHPSDAAPRPVDLRRTETVAGETCTWFDMIPGMMDAGYAQCRSPDGVVLKDMVTRRGGVAQSLVAVELSRAAVSLDAVLPPPAILAPATWGIPEFR